MHNQKSPARIRCSRKGEASNSLRRAIFFHRQGEIRDRTFENQSFRASGLSLLTAAIVHWNTVYLERAVQHLRAQGVHVPDDLLSHLFLYIFFAGGGPWSIDALRRERHSSSLIAGSSMR